MSNILTKISEICYCPIAYVHVSFIRFVDSIGGQCLPYQMNGPKAVLTGINGWAKGRLTRTNGWARGRFDMNEWARGQFDMNEWARGQYDMNKS